VINTAKFSKSDDLYDLQITKLLYNL